MITEKNWKKIKAAHADLLAQKKSLQSQILKLEKAGIINGSISYKVRKNKSGDLVRYARLLRPGGGNEYIGLDRERLAIAESAIKRYADYMRLSRDLSDIDVILAGIEQDFQTFVDSYCY